MPTGNQLRAGRVLAGLEQRHLAKLAGLDITTISRMERSGDSSVRGFATNVEKVVIALERSGVEITPDGVRLIPGKGKGR
jgi:transcriptional regulator with XRE-family HTH domain